MVETAFMMLGFRRIEPDSLKLFGRALPGILLAVDRMQRNFEPMRKQVEAWQKEGWKESSRWHLRLWNGARDCRGGHRPRPRILRSRRPQYLSARRNGDRVVRLGRAGWDAFDDPDHSKEDRAKFDRLPEDADMFFGNRRPDYFEKYGLTAEEVSYKNPGLIHATMAPMASGVLGQTGWALMRSVRRFRDCFPSRRIRARSELNPLRVVRMCQQVDALAFLAHDGDSDGHGSRIHR